MAEPQNNSEVARVRTLIDQEAQMMFQMYRGLSSGTAKHAFIAARMTRISEHHQALAVLVGTDASLGIICEIIGESSGNEEGSKP